METLGVKEGFFDLTVVEAGTNKQIANFARYNA